MTATTARVWSAVLLRSGLLALIVACDGNSPARPDSVGQEVARIEVTGPRTLAPGQTATFKATAFYRIGSTRDVTAEARWSSPSFTVFRMDAPGRGTAGSRGDAAISVQLGGVSSTVYVVVVPEGTYRLSGVVRTADAAGDLVFGARVDALDLPERLETTTDPQGRYVLFGVPGAVRIRITRAGYITSEDTIQLTDHQSVDFALTLSEPLPDISGTYTLRITLVTPCGDPDPGSEFRDRTYTATVTHSSRRSVRVRLTGADLVVSRGRGDGFSGSVDPSGATFFIDEDFYLYSYPEIVERLPNGRYFVVGGHVSTKKAPEGLVGTMSGLMIFYDGPPTQSRVIAWCLSDDIRFALLK